MKKACLTLALHPYSVSTNSDGVPDKKRSNSYHRFSAWAESDGSLSIKRSNNLHLSTLSANSDGASSSKHQIGLHPSLASSQFRWRARDSPTLPAVAYDVYFRTLLNYNHQPGFPGLLRSDLWGNKATSGVVCPQVWTNYPRGRFSLKCTMV